jgi:hypothetical protein
MSDYIKREDAKRGLCEWATNLLDPRFLIKDDAMCVLDNIPAADVAPVVRCENCTSGIMSDDNKYIICCRLGVGMELDDFCSYGEGKNGGSDYATD